MSRNTERKYRLIALGGTLAFHAALLALLLLVWLAPPRMTALAASTAEDDDPEILLGSEYVMAGDVDVISDEPLNDPATTVTAEGDGSREGVDLQDHGPEGETAPTVTSKQPSPAKATERPRDRSGAAPSRPNDKKAADKAAQESAERVAARTNFGTKSSDKATGNTGSPDGTSNQVSTAGVEGYNVSGRTLASFKQPTGHATGKIVVKVTVNRQGKVTSAAVTSGSGPVYSDQAARSSCEAAARASRFSVATDGPATQTGTITYRFK